jgi:hypothetical protein
VVLVGAGEVGQQVVTSPVLLDELKGILVEKFGFSAEAARAAGQRSRAAALTTVLTNRS